MTSAERRQIGHAMREIAEGREGDGLAALSRLAGDQAWPYQRSTLKEKLERWANQRERWPHLAQPARLREANHAAVLPQPKPRKRIVDRKALKEYADTHPRCEVIACPQEPCPEPHHLISRKMKGDDVPANLLRLCVHHHQGWHTVGGTTWLSIYRRGLTADTLSKVSRALRMGEGE
jgi:hypothetical protein